VRTGTTATSFVFRPALSSLYFAPHLLKRVLRVTIGTYYCAILENRADFDQKVVVDVGAGSSILSQFACQAGARKVGAPWQLGCSMGLRVF
jgi:predicted RNA methylase